MLWVPHNEYKFSYFPVYLGFAWINCPDFTWSYRLRCRGIRFVFFRHFRQIFLFFMYLLKIIQYTTKPLSASITAVENYCQHYKINMAAIYKIIEKYRCVFNLSCILQHQLTYPINRRIFLIKMNRIWIINTYVCSFYIYKFNHKFWPRTIAGTRSVIALIPAVCWSLAHTIR